MPELAIQRIAAGTFCLLLSLAAPASAQLSTYQRTLEKLSEPVAARWQHFGAPYFSTNEKLLNSFYSRFDNAGGATVGVSFQQNFSLLVHARPAVCVMFDYNPGVTEILVPFMGEILTRSPTRREFISTLLGADLTAEETARMLEGRSPVAEVLTAVLERTDPAKRKLQIEALRMRLRDGVLAGLPAAATPHIRAQALTWIDILENEELLTGAFFADAIAPYKLSTIPVLQKRMAGWLSTESNYALVRSYWMSGRIIGVTGDIGGTSVAKLAEYLRESKLQVTALYLSNVGVSTEGHFPEVWFRDLYRTLTGLPLSSGALTLVAQGPWQLTGYVRSFKQAKWVYESLADVPEQVAIRLHEAPLEMLTQLGMPGLFEGIRKGLAAVDASKEYYELVKRVESDPAIPKLRNLAEFREWAAKAAPNADQNAAVFKALTVTLAESGRIPHPDF